MTIKLSSIGVVVECRTREEVSQLQDILRPSLPINSEILNPAVGSTLPVWVRTGATNAVGFGGREGGWLSVPDQYIDVGLKIISFGEFLKHHVVGTPDPPMPKPKKAIELF